MKTFEDVIEELGAGTVYAGTDVDNATKGALLEWLFDLNICTGDDSQKFCRYYRRQLNMVYPLYVDYLKLEAVRSNMDPFITEYMDHTHEDDKTLSGTATKANTGTVADNGSITDTAESQTVRTPDITTTTSSTNTETRNLSSSSASDANHEEESEVNTKNRSVNIAYPEANLNSLPLGIDDMPTDIDYAAAENDSFGRTNTEGTSEDHSTGSNTETGTVEDDASGTGHEGGTETTDYDGSSTKTMTNTRTNNLSESVSTSGTEATDYESHDEGRHESEADILPRAIKAITTTNAIKWLVKSLQVCFDNFSEL